MFADSKPFGLAKQFLADFPGLPLSFVLALSAYAYQRSVSLVLAQRGKRRGQHIGRTAKLTEYQRREAASMLDDGKARSDIAALLGVHVGTLRRALKA